MSEMSKSARAAARSKIDRMMSAKPGKVDASDYTPPPLMDSERQTGMKPINPRAYKNGGKVAGEKHAARADRKPRKADGGGLTDPRAAAAARMMQAGETANVPTSVMNFSGVRKGDLSPMRALKNGGKAKHRASGGENWIKGAIKHPGALHEELHVKKGEKIPAKKLEKAENSKNPTLARRARMAETLKGMNEKCDGGRVARKAGGRAKGKTNVNIIIAQHPSGGNGPGAPSPGGMPPHPIIPPASMAGAGGTPQGAPMPMPMGPPPGGPGGSGGLPPGLMGRKSGGRVPLKMEFGSGSGEGRLEKARKYGPKPPK